ncbi:unnamed protein product [Discula destructiva]
MGLGIITHGVAVAALAYYQSQGEYDDFHSKFNLKAAVGVAIAIGVLVLVGIHICLALDIVCIVKRYRHTLHPRFFLIINIVQTSLWTIMFIMGFFTAFSILSLILSVIPLMSFWGLLAYAAIIYHRERKGTLSNRGTYTLTPHANDNQFQTANSYAVHDNQPYAQNYPEPKYGPTLAAQQQPYAQNYAAQVPAGGYPDHAASGGERPYEHRYYGPANIGQGRAASPHEGF